MIVIILTGGASAARTGDDHGDDLDYDYNYDNYDDNDDENHGSWLLGRLRRRLVTAKIDRTGLAALAMLLLTRTLFACLFVLCINAYVKFLFFCRLFSIFTRLISKRKHQNTMVGSAPGASMTFLLL